MLNHAQHVVTPELLHRMQNASTQIHNTP